MSYLIITALASIEVPDHKNLIAAWRSYGGPGSLVGSFTVRKQLTRKQLCGLPAELRARLVGTA
jgi:hypothetical protein